MEKPIVLENDVKIDEDKERQHKNKVKQTEKNEKNEKNEEKNEEMNEVAEKSQNPPTSLEGESTLKLNEPKSPHNNSNNLSTEHIKSASDSPGTGMFHRAIFETSSPFRNIERSVSPCEITNPSSPLQNQSKLELAEPAPRQVPMDSVEDQIDLTLASSNNPTAVMELDLDGNVSYMSKNWEVIVGTRIKKILRKPISNIIIGNSHADYQVFNNAIEQMVKDDFSYKVKFITATNDRAHFGDANSSGNATPNHSLEDLTQPENPESLQIPEDLPTEDLIVDSQISSDSDDSTVSSKVSNNGDVIELEAQGIIIHDQKTNLPTHSMWTIRPSVHIDLELTLPENLIDLLGFGSEIFESYLVDLKESGITDERDMPQPDMILCRICESHVPSWFIERHSELCIVEYRANEDLQASHDAINEHANLIQRIYDYLLQQSQSPSPQPGQKPLSPPNSQQQSPTSSPSNSPNQSLTLNTASPPFPPEESLPLMDYKGIPLPGMSNNEAGGSPKLANQVLTKNFHASNPMIMNRRFPFGTLQRLIDLCKEAAMINPVETNGNGDLEFSPNTERAISSVINWKFLETLDPAIKLLGEDTKALVMEKVDILSRFVSVLQYSNKIKQEVDNLVLETVRQTIQKIKEQTLLQEYTSTSTPRISMTDLSETVNDEIDTSSNDDTHVSKSIVSNTVIHSPRPSRNRSPQSSTIFPETFLKDDDSDKSINSVTPKDILLRGRTSDIIRRESINSSSSRSSASNSFSGKTRNNSRDLVGSIGDLDLTKKNSGNKDNLMNPPTLSASSSFSLPRRHLSPAPYVEKQKLSSFQRNINSRFDTNTPHTSPSISDTHGEDPIHHGKRSSSGGSSMTVPLNLNMHYQPGSHRNSISKPPLSPLLVSTTPNAKPSGGGIKDYEVIKPISKGAFGSVFLAKRKLTGDYVAIKCLKKRDMIAKNQISNVKSERAVMMKQTDSPYVAQLYSSFQSKDYLYLVMEYLHGGDCATLVKNLGTLGNDWARRYIAEVIVGVDDLHKRGVIHRDLKPDNLLIDSKGHLKLTDFGLSRIGVVGRQAVSRRKSSSNEHGIELFRKSISQQSAIHNSPLSHVSGSFGVDSPLSESGHKRTSSVTPFSLSPTLENTKLNTAGPPLLAASLTSPTLSYLESFSQQPQIPASLSHRTSSIFKGNRSGSNSSGLESPLLKPVLPRTSSESSFALVEDDFQVSPSHNQNSHITNFALFDPSNENSNEVKNFVGTPDYLAPETIEGVGQNESSDWWSLGCILFEFLFGYPPFHADTPDKVFKKILKGSIDWPPLSEEEEKEFCTPEAKDLIKKLLNLDPKKRLGANGADEIKSHDYFRGMDWDTLFDEEASFVPTIEDPESTDYFDLRGADIAQFPKEDSDEENQYANMDKTRTNSGFTTDLGSPSLGGNSSGSSSSLLVPGTNNNSNHSSTSEGGKRERRSSRLADPSEFGSFHFRNLSVLEKQNKDVINRLKSEHLEHRNSFSSSSSDSTPLARSRGFSFSGSNNQGSSPFKRPVSPIAMVSGSGSGSGTGFVTGSTSGAPGRSCSPHKSLEQPSPSPQSVPFRPEIGPGSAISAYSSGDEFPFEFNKSSPSAELFSADKHKSSVHSLFKQTLKDSPSDSDTEDTKSSALLRVKKRRESSRRIAPTGHDEDRPSPTNFKELDVLYCESIPIVRHSVAKMLEKCGCIVVAISDGDELIRRATSQVKFDIIFTALRLSRTDAIDAVKLIKFTNSANTGTPIVAITGFAEEARDYQIFDDIIEKPVDVHQVQKCLTKLAYVNNDEAIESDNEGK